VELEQQFGADVQFIGVPEPSDDVETNLDFINDTGSGAITHLQDPEGQIWSDFGVARRQTYILITADGSSSQVSLEELPDRLAELALP